MDEQFNKNQKNFFRAQKDIAEGKFNFLYLIEPLEKEVLWKYKAICSSLLNIIKCEFYEIANCINWDNLICYVQLKWAKLQK